MFSVTVACSISHSKKNSGRFYNCADVYVTYPLFLSDLNETRKFSRDLRKYVKFHANLSSRRRVILCEQVDVTKLTVAFAGGKSGLLLLLAIDRLSLPLLCTFVARRDGRTVRPSTQSCVKYMNCVWVCV